MFSNRFTALVDACSLADVLRRNLLLTELCGILGDGSLRLRFKKPELNADDLLTRMEGRGLIETADVLRPYRESL